MTFVTSLPLQFSVTSLDEMLRRPTPPGYKPDREEPVYFSLTASPGASAPELGARPCSDRSTRPDAGGPVDISARKAVDPVMATRESLPVELVDANGAATGTCTVAEAHTAPGRLHRAFSVMLLDDRGRVLIQRRAAEKTRFALCWANACCGHPAPGQGVSDAAAERLSEEIGVLGVTLREAGVYVYRAEDPLTGRVEHEYDHVVVGRVPVEFSLRPDPSEVAEVHWSAPGRLRAELADHPDHYAPWFSGVFAVTTDAAGRLPEAAALALSP